MAEKYFIVVNPLSGGGRSAKTWPLIEARLHADGFDYTHKFTEYQFHTYTIVQQALADGYRNILIVGGDGSLNEAVNGIFDQQMVPTADVKLGLISIGTGNDWGKTMQVPASFESLAPQTITSASISLKQAKPLSKMWAKPFISKMASKNIATL